MNMPKLAKKAVHVGGFFGWLVLVLGRGGVLVFKMQRYLKQYPRTFQKPTLSNKLQGDILGFAFKKGIIFQKACIHLLMPRKFEAVLKDAGSGFRVLHIWLPFPHFTPSSCLFCDQANQEDNIMANKLYREISGSRHQQYFRRKFSTC